ncbi:unnamed protein product [Polarella glacialis]|uniref:Uncharacterized protein n=1 Tax=Polarella glacialis TaxID=89957 RepID=A0A813FZ96_POLGL|nr:unnamed protein product [Polarella glacialis]
MRPFVLTALSVGVVAAATDSHGSCQRFVRSLQKTGDVELALMCRSRLHPQECSGMLATLGDRPWAPANQDRMCENYADTLVQNRVLVSDGMLPAFDAADLISKVSEAGEKGYDALNKGIDVILTNRTTALDASIKMKKLGGEQSNVTMPLPPAPELPPSPAVVATPAVLASIPAQLKALPPSVLQGLGDTSVAGMKTLFAHSIYGDGESGTDAPAGKAPATAVVAAATEAPATTEAVSATEAPATTVAVSVTDAPATDAPATTEAVTATEAPATSVAVSATEAPATTVAVSATEAPATSVAVSATEAPATTVAVSATEAPATSVAVTATEAPATTVAVSATDSPATTEAVTVTEATATTVAVSATEAPASEVAPVQKWQQRDGIEASFIQRFSFSPTALGVAAMAGASFFVVRAQRAVSGRQTLGHTLLNQGDDGQTRDMELGPVRPLE